MPYTFFVKRDLKRDLRFFYLFVIRDCPYLIIAWTWANFGNYPWRVNSLNIFTWMHFAKWYRGPSQKSLSSEVVKRLISQIPIWHRVGDRTDEKRVNWNVSVGLKWVRTSRTDFVSNHDGVQESYFSSCEFDCRVVFICSFNELSVLFLLCLCSLFYTEFISRIKALVILSVY